MLLGGKPIATETDTLLPIGTHMCSYVCSVGAASITSSSSSWV